MQHFASLRNRQETTDFEHDVDTEIDWIAYMQEVGGYLGGELDYTKLGGNTGPLVYPAGFVYIYSVLKFATDDGSNILRGESLCSALLCSAPFLPEVL